MYTNPRLKHVNKIKYICVEEEGEGISSKTADLILDQCNLLLEKKKKKSKYSLPGEKEILGMLDGLVIIKTTKNK